MGIAWGSGFGVQDWGVVLGYESHLIESMAFNFPPVLFHQRSNQGKFTKTRMDSGPLKKNKHCMLLKG